MITAPKLFGLLAVAFVAGSFVTSPELRAFAANNHYAGFGPSTANSIRKLIGLDEVKWDEMKQARLDV
jgi:hypothetical protein